MTKFKAFGIHILISIFITASALSAMYLLWYPDEYFWLMGGKKLILLLSSADILLGPLLTLIVFKSGKKNLHFDLSIIAIIQTLALSYGIYVMFQSRPVFTVFNKDKFQISAVVDIAPEELAKAKNPDWRKFSIKGPELVAIGTPDKSNKKEAMFAKVESDNAYRYPILYEQYNKHLGEVVKSAKPLKTLYQSNVKNKPTIDQFIKKNKRPQSDFSFLPITSELAKMSVIIDAKTGSFIEIIDAKD